jgi:hypothetical protein
VLSLKPEVGKPLPDLPGSEVGFVEDLQELEILAEQSRDFSGTVSNNLEATALLRPVESERT